MKENQFWLSFLLQNPHFKWPVRDYKSFCVMPKLMIPPGRSEMVYDAVYLRGWCTLVATPESSPAHPLLFSFTADIGWSCNVNISFWNPAQQQWASFGWPPCPAYQNPPPSTSKMKAEGTWHSLVIQIMGRQRGTSVWKEAISGGRRRGTKGGHSSQSFSDNKNSKL